VKATVSEFIAAWTTSDSLQEVSAKTGIKYQGCSSRARHIRKLGYDLKNFKTGRKPKAILDAAQVATGS
jgi:hypothetical protein